MEFLLNTIKDLLLHHISLFTDTKSQIENLENDLRDFRDFLKESGKKRRRDDIIRNIVYEGEDIIDKFGEAIRAKKMSENTKDYLKTLYTLGGEMAVIRKRVNQARQRLTLPSVVAAEEPPLVRKPRMRNVVGFEDVTADLINRLRTETKYFDIIGLTGMLGLGKTTLAWKIYNDAQIKRHFPIRIWLSISQQFSPKDIFLDILGNYTTVTEELRKKGELELSAQVAHYLESGRFLIIMDDVWTTKAWNKLKDVMPQNNKRGKVLITSREKDVGTCVSLPREPIELRFFRDDESWELLRLEALGKLDCSSEDLSKFGKGIAKDCGGLPLAVVVIGGILATKYSSDVSKMISEWEKVSKRVHALINTEDPEERMNKFISLSYDGLPDYLHQCFLYLGIFPEDYEIPVSKLIRMWIAEKFIQDEEDCSQEETADIYLEKLINRNLVSVEKFKPDGKVKTCKLHDTLREFCRTEAGYERENMFKEIKHKDGDFVPPISSIGTNKYRRLSVHSKCLEFLSLKPKGPQVRSLVCIPKVEVSSFNVGAIPAAFKLLRVLDVIPIRFKVMHANMYKLLHLRFIAFSLDSNILPQNFGNLWNIQTLIVDTTFSKLEVKADIWELKQLRHFKTNASATLLPSPSRDSEASDQLEAGAQLQTLGTISAESCTAELVQRAPNLKKLGIRGRLALLFEGNDVSSLANMANLEKLKLVNDLVLEGQQPHHPQQVPFPSQLKRLTLCATLFKWSYMSTLGLLEKLEVLKLKDKAFMGDIWEVVAGGFRRLKFLHIENTDLMAWRVSSHDDFPVLRSLVLRNCEKLAEIPVLLADRTSFQMLDLYMCTDAVDSAKNIQEKKQQNQGPGVTAFSLSISPN